MSDRRAAGQTGLAAYRPELRSAVARVRAAPAALQRKCGSDCGCASCGSNARSAEDVEADPVQRAAEGAQRSRATGAAPLPGPGRHPATLTVQRHKGWRTKGSLETEVLGAPEVQKAAARASAALTVGRSTGDAVARLQKGLNAAGYDVRITSKYDSATQAAVSRFQAAHRIPYPTGREAGPKTLSALDDHLLGGGPKPAPKPPSTKCKGYLPKERETSMAPGSPGGAQELDEDRLLLTDFAPGRSTLKPAHMQAITRFMNNHGYDLPGLEVGCIKEIQGRADCIDDTKPNYSLRKARAEEAARYINTWTAGNTQGATVYTPGFYSYSNDTPEGRANNRSALIVITRQGCKKQGPDPEPKPPPKPKPKEPTKCEELTRKWSIALTGTLSGAEIIGGAIFWGYLKNRESGCTRIIRIKAATLGAGLSAPVSKPDKSWTDFETEHNWSFDDWRTWPVFVDFLSLDLLRGYGALYLRFLSMDHDPKPLDLGGWEMGLGFSGGLGPGVMNTNTGCDCVNAGF